MSIWFLYNLLGLQSCDITHLVFPAQLVHKPLIQHMGVDHGGPHLLVPEQFLNTETKASKGYNIPLKAKLFPPYKPHLITTPRRLKNRLFKAPIHLKN
jgi:hypothetical protein